MTGITRCWRHCGWKWVSASLIVVGGAITYFEDCALAQITPDRTLPNNSRITTEGNTSVINGGTRAGSNLFHSFEQFSVPTGSAAFFNNAPNIQNIISRVTGGSASNIDGLIQANGTANLFLLNPNGIIFGPNASLNIGGSFVATTANAIGFGNQGFFSASNPNNPALLSVNPSAFLFNQIAAASIQNNSFAPAGVDPTGSVNISGLRVSDGQSLMLVGGDISMDGGRLNAFGGQVELGGLVGAGTVGLNVDGDLLGLSFPNNVERADVSLSNDSRVYVLAGGGGSITINARNLDISGESRLYTGILQRLGTDGSQAGDITLNVTEAIRVRQSSNILNQVTSNATGNSGDVIITTGSLFVTDGSQLSASTYGQGDAGSVIINARERVSFDGTSSDGSSVSGVFNDLEETGIGKGGDIRITTGELSVTNGAGLIATTSGQGDAGSVVINARERVSFDGTSSDGSSGSAAFSRVNESGIGKGGDIRITTGELSVTNGPQLLANTKGQGDAGNVIIDARERVSFGGVSSSGSSGVFSYVESGAVGNGGSINIITTGSLSLTNGSVLNSGSFGEGRGSDVKVTAGSIRLDLGGIGSLTTSGNGGEARLAL